MFHMNVLIGHAGSVIQFLFKERESAMAALRSIETDSSDFATVTDDFGGYLTVRKSAITAVEIVDLVKAGDAAIERAINQQKMQIRGSRRAAEDPILKLNQMAPMNHPGIQIPNARRPI